MTHDHDASFPAPDVGHTANGPKVKPELAKGS